MEYNDLIDMMFVIGTPISLVIVQNVYKMAKTGIYIGTLMGQKIIQFVEHAVVNKMMYFARGLYF